MRLAVVSFETNKKFYIIIGEIYDKAVIDLDYIFNIYDDLFRICPFKCVYTNKKLYTTIESDFNILRKKYKLTPCLTLTGSAKIKTGTRFLSPILFDVENNKKIYTRKIVNPSYIPLSNSIGIILPILNPFDRGNVIDQVLLSKPKCILVSGDKQKDNVDSTCILSFRYLRKREFERTKIIKNINSNIQDILCILNLTFNNEKHPLIIGCDYETMISLRNVITDRSVSYRV